MITLLMTLILLSFFLCVFIIVVFVAKVRGESISAEMSRVFVAESNDTFGISATQVNRFWHHDLIYLQNFVLL